MFRQFTTRSYQRLRPPQSFNQTVHLTDGSTIAVRSISPRRPWIAMPIDSLSHPSWNPLSAADRSKILDEEGQLARFKKKWGEMDAMEALGGDLGITSGTSKTIPKAGVKKTPPAKAAAVAAGKKKK